MLNESILDKLMQFESDKEILTIGHWMMKNPPYITLDKTLRDATLILRNERIDFLPVVNEALNPIGVITIDDVMDAFLNGDLGETKLEHMMSPKVTSIMESTLLSELLSYTNHNHIVTNKLGSLTGIIREEDILQGIITLINRYVKNEKVTAILNVILEKAYEGIAVVDEEGILIEFNDAYSKFTGISRENAIGKHVTEVIENTGLHKTVKKGIPARSVLQNIQGQEMIVHRIPIWNNGKVVGAIGMLIFEGVSEVYRIYERLQLQKVVTTKNTDSNQQNNLASIDQIVGISEKNSELKRLARKAGQNRANVLLIGENGAGKKIFGQPKYANIIKTKSPKTMPIIIG